jgi:hypothetical protein
VVSWARWARFSMEKIVYYNRYNTFRNISIVPERWKMGGWLCMNSDIHILSYINSFYELRGPLTGI